MSSRTEGCGTLIGAIAALIPAVVGLLVYLDNRNTPKPSNSPPLTLSITPSPSPRQPEDNIDISGIWLNSANGAEIVIKQNGNNVTLQSFSSGIQVFQGRGTIVGRKIYFTFNIVDGSFGQGEMDLSPDGRQANVNWQDNLGRTGFASISK